MSSSDNTHKYQKDKDGFKIEAIDPIQDIMNEQELSQAEKRIESLLDDDSK
jgi:hypothetical protein